MQIDIMIVLAILWAHWVGDFILQSDWHAVNKSKSNWILLHHVGCYSIPLAALGFVMPVSIAWVVANAVLHAMTDYVTSRATSYLWQKEQRHWFFVVIGFDQSIHFTCLFTTYLLLVV